MEYQHMKQIPGRNTRSLAHAFTTILLGTASLALALVPIARATSDVIVQAASGVSYVYGGIGDDSIERLNSLAGGFNLKLVFALNSGNYVSGVRVAIADAAGKTVLDTTSEGPWFLVKVPAGNYQVVATFAGNAVKRQIAVGASALRTVDFRWASE
jgi:hypothetical protein